MKNYLLALGTLVAVALMMGAGSIVNTPGVPAGAIMAFGMSGCPQGWEAADGTPRSKTVKYKALCDAITTSWGAGDASNCATPDLKTSGRYLRAANPTNPVGTMLAQGTVWNNMTAALTSGTVGGTVGSAVDGTHGHTLTAGAWGVPTSVNGTQWMLWTNAGINNGSSTTLISAGGHSHTHALAVGTAVTKSSTDTETRPISAAVTYCIKY